MSRPPVTSAIPKAVRNLLFLSLLLLVVTPPASAQVATGTPPFGSFGGGPDVIDLANLNSHITVPVLNKGGRGMNFTYDLSYDTSIWYRVTSGSTTVWTPVTNWGWRGETEVALGYISYNVAVVKWPVCQQYETAYADFVYHDPLGIGHAFDSAGVMISNTGCFFPQSKTGTARDASGFTLSASVATGTLVVTLTDSTGHTVNAPLLTTSGSGSSVDRNGNEITVNSSGQFFDTLSSTTPVLTVSGTAPSNTTFTYSAPSASAVYTMKYTTYTVNTNFGCSNVNEYPATSTSLVSEIDLPDYNATTNPNSRYLFSYEVTPGDTHNPHYVTGRLVSVTLPTGGSITYTYTGGSSGNITCADGSTAGLTRVLSDGASWSATWTYARTPGSGAAYTTTITDPERDSLAPNGNQTVIQFQGIYETERQIYQGTTTAGTLMETLNTCYNGAAIPCTGTAITLPIASRKIDTALAGGLVSEHDDSWNIYGAPTETDDYDYGSGSHGPLLKKVLATYETNLGNITAFRQQVIICNGSGTSPSCNNVGTPVSEINYNYDQTAPTPTTGTPQHISIPAPWGNLTSTNVYTSSGTYLTKSTTYYDTGNDKTATDVNGGITTFNYTAGSASCYNSFATSINEAVSGLTTNATWNCTGGVQLTAQDENGQTTTTTYSDPYYWQPYSVADPTGATTYFCRGLVSSGTCSPNPNQVESYLTFNSGASTVDRFVTVDGLGRSRVQQTRQSPSSTNFDSVETDYDALGRAKRVTLPYSAAAGGLNSTIASTQTTYDAMGRLLTIQDGASPPGTTTYNYGTANDILVTISPAPTGENNKVHQFEYDGLTRLTSTCEVTGGTTAWPGGTCAQTTNKTGYWTRYTYDPIGNLLSVTQNAQSTSNQQARTYTYDWMSRMTSETVPEIGTNGNGTATDTYDADSTCGSYTGDLVKRVDAAGDVICFAYDALHRQTSQTYPSGTYASVTPAKTFVYDSASAKCATPTYVLSRLVEAYTGPSSSKVTDEIFCYSQRGETSDVYESTPHSGTTYYHVNQTYWANRLLDQLTGNVGLPPTITYAPDPEGRISSVSASSGQSPLVSSTTYSVASLPTAINIGSGSGDSDGYTYDPNTNRMTQYQFIVNGTSLTGALGWNTNGTLLTQNITDGYNSLDAQNCSYQYDDIVRVISANCASAASQTFAFDPFGNITKSGSPYSFQPTYSTSTNRMTAVGSTTPTYDGNGNLTMDNLHNYAWDADGHALAVDAGDPDAVSLTYDALGRMVEQNRNSTYTQIAYSPTGQKLALMNGSSLNKGMVMLSGKAQAVYNSSGLLYYAHADLLGSFRLATTPTTRLMYFDTAYAPFGETYASTGTLDPAYTGQMNDTAHREDVISGQYALYDFPAREYSVQGRWPNPDPAGASATCPKDPQSQNRYAYVRNNPITRIDPTGTQDCDPEDPFCDPCVLNPLACIAPPPVGGGGGGGRGESNAATGPCGCKLSDVICVISAVLFGCREDYGPEGCRETTYNSPPAIQGDACAGNLVPPHIFIQAWSCAGDVTCCQNKEKAFISRCYDTPGQTATLVQPLGPGALEGAQCCKQPPAQPKPKSPK
jgi:RHS repeat-associated protein